MVSWLIDWLLGSLYDHLGFLGFLLFVWCGVMYSAGKEGKGRGFLLSMYVCIANKE